MILVRTMESPSMESVGSTDSEEFNEDLFDIYQEVQHDSQDTEEDLESLDQYLESLNNQIPDLYAYFMDGTIGLSEFQDELLGVQEKIAITRTKILRSYLSLEDYRSLKREIEELLELMQKYKVPQTFVVHGKKKITEKIKDYQYEIIQMYDSIFFKYNSLKQTEEDLSKNSIASGDRLVYANTTDEEIKWFSKRLPQNTNEQHLVDSYFKNVMKILNNEDLIEIFGNLDTAQDFYQNIGVNGNQSMFEVFPTLKAHFENNQYKLLSLIMEQGAAEELKKLKAKVIKSKRFSKQEVERDFEILTSRSVPEELLDSDMSTEAILKKIRIKYNDYLPTVTKEPKKIVEKIKFKTDVEKPIQKTNIYHTITQIIKQLPPQNIKRCIDQVCSQKNCTDILKINEQNYRTKARQNIYNHIATLGNPQVVKKHTIEIENAIASLFSNIMFHKEKYNQKIEEAIYIIQQNPDIIEKLTDGSLLPTDIINIYNGYDNQRFQENQHITLQELLDWEPDHSLISRYQDLYDMVLKETQKESPNPNIITFDMVRDINVPITLKKNILQQAYEIVKWNNVLHKVKNSSQPDSNKRNYLIKQREKLPSRITKAFVPPTTKIQIIKQLSNKLTKKQIDLLDLVVSSFISYPREYLVYMQKLSKINQNRLTTILKLDTDKMIYELAKELFIIPEGTNLLEAPTKVLEAIVKVGNGLEENISKINKVRRVIDTKVQDALRESYDSNIKYIHNWRKKVYVSPVYSQKIPHNFQGSILPLPNNKGYLLGGNFPNNPTKYRYYDNQKNLKTHIDTILQNFVQGRINTTFPNNNIKQTITPQEELGFKELESILDRSFYLKDSVDYTLKELEDICQSSGFMIDDPSYMYKLCIGDNIEPNPQTLHPKLMTLKQFKVYKKSQNPNLTDKEIVKMYYLMKKSQDPSQLIPYKIMNNGKAYRVTKDKTNRYPVPIEQSGDYPVYSVRQLNDLAELLVTGNLSPWLVSDIKPVYSQSGSKHYIQKGTVVRIEDKDKLTNKHVSAVGVVEELGKTTAKVRYSYSDTKGLGKHHMKETVGEFLIKNLKMVVDGDVVGFEGNPPWIVTNNQNIDRTIKYIESLDPQDPNYKFIIGTIGRNYYVRTKDYSRKYAVGVLMERKKFLESGADRELVIKTMGFLNPLSLATKIKQKYKDFYGTYNYINSYEFKNLPKDSKNQYLAKINKALGLGMQKIDSKRVLKKLASIIRDVEKTLEHLRSNIYWSDLIITNFPEALKEYTSIADEYGIPSEKFSDTVLADLVKYKIKQLDSAIQLVLENPTIDLVGVYDIFKDFNIPIITTREEVLSKLRSIKGRYGEISSFYIEKTFLDKFQKEIKVKEGVSKSKIVWKPLDWDPCSYFTVTEMNARVLMEINYIENNTLTQEKVIEIMEYWNIPKPPKGVDVGEYFIKNLRKKLDLKKGYQRCGGGHVSKCYWDNNSKTCKSGGFKNTSEVESPEQRAYRLLEKHGNIENIPTRNYARKEFKKYKKTEDVWSWVPSEEKDAKIWNREVKNALREMQNTVYNRVRSSSYSFKNKKLELTKRLEIFRSNMESQKVGYRKPRPKKIIKPKLEDFFSISDINDNIELMVRCGIIKLTSEAKRLINDINQNNSPFKNYIKYSLIEKNNEFISIPNKTIELRDIIQNMNHTRSLELDLEDNTNISPMGRIYDFLVHNTGITGKTSCKSLKKPSSPLRIMVRDVLDYLGDSYYQYGDYVYGVVDEKILAPGCVYHNMVTDDNKFVTFVPDTDVFQGIYMIDQNLHRNNAITTNKSRRLAFLLGIDISKIPPCFSSRVSQREGRKNAINYGDVHTYFLRSGRGFDISEMEEEDIQGYRNKEILYKHKKKQQEEKKRYQQALKKLDKKSEDIKKIAFKYDLDYYKLKEMVETGDVDMEFKLKGTEAQEDTMRRIFKTISSRYKLDIEDYLNLRNDVSVKLRF